MTDKEIAGPSAGSAGGFGLHHQSPPDRPEQGRRPIDPAELIDASPVGRFQIAIFVLLSLVTFFDGFDIQVMALVAPVLAKDWQLEPSAFGPIFSMTLAGFMAGQFVFGRLADQFGRRSMLIVSVLIFSLFTLGCALAGDWWSLLLLRFAVGIGLGGAVPIVLALVAELAPQRAKALMIGIVTSGYSTGAIAGAYTAGKIAEEYWQGVFIIGGMSPLILCILLFVFLPESPAYLAYRGAYPERLRKLMRKIAPSRIDDNTSFRPSEVHNSKISFWTLVDKNYRRLTIFIWAAFFLMLMSSYCLLSWLPVLMTERGISLYHASWVFMAFNLGGAVGAIAAGYLIDRFRPSAILALTLAIGAGLILVASVPTIGFPSIVFLMLAAGFFGVGGGQKGFVAYATTLYPAKIRATGVGVAFAVGRIGGILGPVLGGAVLAGHLPGLNVFLLVGLLWMLMSLVLLKGGPQTPRRAST